MRSRRHIAAVLALAGIAGGLAACQEPPSYRLRWAIEGRDSLDINACAESGLFEMRARVYTDSAIETGILVDERTYPCFPSALRSDDGAVNGSPLPPGRYAIELRGVDRTGNPWDHEALPSLDPDAPEHPGCSVSESADFAVECRPNELVCDCQRLVITAAGSTAVPADDDTTVIEEGQTATLPELRLVPPPECEDGIDNDRDGLVDIADASCNVDFGDGTEAVPVGVTELQLGLTLLGRNPAVTCSGVPLRRLRLSIDVGVDGSGETQVVLEEPCRIDQPYLSSLRLPAGPATFSVDGVDGAGQPVTIVKTFTAEISPIGGTVQREIDFGPNDFLEPIVAPIEVPPGYVSELGPEASVRFSCAPQVLDASSGLTRGQLTIDRLRVLLLNGHGGPLDAPAALEDGTVLDGAATIACTNRVTTEALVWGSYTMVIEALSAEGEVCFSNASAPTLMSPGGLSSIFMPRLYGSDGQVPASCHDCEVDADCGLGGELYCIDNVCQGACVSDDTTDEDDEQCRSDALGDLGFACIDDVCRRG